MTKIAQTVTKAGHSLVVVVPAKFAKQLGVNAGDEVKVEVKTQKAQITYTFTSARQLTLV